MDTLGISIITRNKYACYLIVVLLCCGGYVQAAVEVAQVYDGDTVKIKDGQQTFKLRLSQIDAPEYNQTYGKKSRRALRKLCQRKSLSVSYRATGLDKYGRTLGYLYCGGQDAGSYMVVHGHAWFNEKYGNDMTLRASQQQAQQQQRGLWKSRNPVPPWRWRELHPHSYSK